MIETIAKTTLAVNNIKSSGNFYSFLIKFGIYLIIFLMPVFFLPFSFESIEFNKQYLLFFGVLISFIGWLGSLFSAEKKIKFIRTPLDIPVLVFSVIVVIATIFSIDKITSILGFYGRFNGNLVEILLLTLFYFILTNNTTLSNNDSQKINIRNLILLLTSSAQLVIIITIFSLFDIWTKIGINNILPNIMKNRLFNPAGGSLESLTVFLTIIVCLAVGVLMSKFELFSIKAKSQESYEKLRRYYNSLKNIVFGLLIISSLFLMFFINFKRAWIILVLALGSYLILAIYSRFFKNCIYRLYLLVTLFIIALLMAVSPLRLNNVVFPNYQLPTEALLSFTDSFKVLYSSFSDIKNVIIGSGPSTFYYDFVKNKPVDFNKGPLWIIRFDKPTNYWFELLTTVGVVGFISFLTILILVLILTIYFLRSSLKSEFWDKLNFLALPWFSLIIAQILYFHNTLLIVSFWIFTALFIFAMKSSILEYNENQKEADIVISYESFPELFLLFYSIYVIFVLVIFVGFYFGIRFYLADYHYLQGTIENTNVDKKVAEFSKAVQLNKYRSIYHLALSQSGWFVSLTEIQKSPDKKDNNKIQAGIALAISEAREAANISPNLVSVWESLALIYKNISPLAANALEWSDKSFEKAIDLEKNNPVHYVELGKNKLLSAEAQGLSSIEKDELREKAKEYFNKAIEIKDNYEDAYIQLALLEESNGNIDKAVSVLENFSKKYPPSENLIYQLGRLYYNRGELSNAANIFRTVLMINPNNVNAHYSLGLVYQRSGLISDAIEEFKIANQINPGNPEILKKLKELGVEIK